MKILSLLIFTVITSTVIAQHKRYKYAENLYANGVYADAAQAYEDVLERGMDSLTVADHISESYDNSGGYEKALSWYTYQNVHQILDKKESLRYSILLATVKSYDMAEAVLENALNRYGNDTILNYRLEELRKFRNSNTIEPNFEMRSIKGNSEYSEMSVIPLNNETFVFSSTRNQRVAVRRYHALNNLPLYDMFIAENDSLGYYKAKRFDENTKYHDATGCFDSINKRFYFTRNNYIDGKPQKDASGKMLLKIMVADFVDGKLKNEKECSFNSNEFSCAHPTISDDGLTLYFTSSMKGGYGGMDLYSVTIDSVGSFGVPKNMGPMVNSPLDELFPFYHSGKKLLFYSSNGHYGFGGLDVFLSKLDKTGMAKNVQNLGEPLNTSKDDFSFLNNGLQTSGYVASNREGGIGDDDLYRFKQLKPYGDKIISGYITDRYRLDSIPEAVVYAYDETGGLLDSTRSDASGFYSLTSGYDGTITLVAKKNRFEDEKMNVDLSSSETEFEVNIKMTPILHYWVVGTVRDKDSRVELGGVKVTVTNLTLAKDITTLNTDAVGYFKTDTIPEFKYGSRFGISLLLEKPGYLTTTFVLYDTLGLTEEINVNAFIDPVMSKVDLGTDLAKLVDLNAIYYDYNKALIRPDAAIELDKIVKVMLENPNIKIELGSHTDTRGTADKNQILAEKRAKAAVDYIISKGIAKNRIKAKGYGESKPLVSDAEIKQMKTLEESEKAHQLNRRTEFRVTEM